APRYPKLSCAEANQFGRRREHRVRSNRNLWRRSVPRMKKTPRAITTLADPYVQNLLKNISEGKRVLNHAKGEKIFSQGDRADAIFSIQIGKVKITRARRRAGCQNPALES